MKTKKIIVYSFFIVGLIAVLIMINNMPVYRSSTTEEIENTHSAQILAVISFVLVFFSNWLIPDKK